jgi:hypothetical protein
MNICNNCGVELEPNMKICPLCGKAANEKAPEPGSKESEQNRLSGKSYFNYASLTKKQRRKLFWELSGIILFSGIIVTFIINLIINKSITWSKYTVTVCLVIFLNTTLISFLQRKTLLLFIGSFILTSILLLLLDMYNQNIGWAVKLGIPFLFSFYCISLILILLIKHSNHRGLNILAWVFIAMGLYTICIEGIISLYTRKLFYLHWSIIVMVCMIPISVVLLFIHYRLKKGIDFKRFFHI